MKDFGLFKKNVNHWLLSCPKAANVLFGLECSHISLCQTQSEEWNIKRVEGTGEEYYHSPEGAMEEARKWFQSLDLYHVSTLFVYGIGLGYYYLAAKDWLKENKSRAIVFLENDLEVIHLLFQTGIGSDLISDPQVVLHYFSKSSNEEYLEADLLSIPAFYFLSDIRFSVLNHYTKKFASYVPIIAAELEVIKNIKGFQLMEYMNYGVAFFQNFYRNLQRLPSAYLGDKLFRQFEGIPAIICGAGPSLEKNLDLIKQLEHRALIFAGGSSINVVDAHGISPHFGVSIDPNWNQYARIFMNQSFQVPFFYRNRIYPQALSLLQGDHLYISGSGGHNIAQYFEKKLGIEPEKILDEGNNVVNFSLSIAQALGCNPIIFAGVDLAYTDNRSYSSGIIPHPILDPEKEIHTKGPDEEVITRSDIHGNRIKTLWKWINESLWIAHFAATNPRFQILNATEGGIGFAGVPNISLKEAIEEHLTISMDLAGYNHGEIQNARLPAEVTEENIIILMNDLKTSLERCKELCFVLWSEFDKVLKELITTKKIPENLITQKAFETLRKLHQEVAYENVLTVFNKSFISFFGQKETELNFVSLEGELDQLDLNMKRCSLNKRRYEFLKTVSESSLRYLNEAQEVERITKLLAKALEKQIQDAKAKSQVEPVQKNDQPPPYEQTQGNFVIKDEQFNLLIEDSYLLNPVVKSHSIKDYVVSEKSSPREGCYQLFYPSGSLKMEQFYKNGELHGPSTYFTEQGNLLAKSWFVNGMRQGKAVYYYLDGTLYGVQNYKDGKLSGMQEYYFPQGALKSSLEYEDGLLHGTVVLYYSDGVKKRELHFSQGKRDGLEIVWNFGAIKEFEGMYQLDKPIGLFRSWYPLGNRSREVTYDQNGNVQDVKGWSKEGTPIPKELLVKTGYFQRITKETNVLTGSLDNMFHEIQSLITNLENFRSSDSTENEMPDFAEDLIELENELKNLKSMNLEMNEQVESTTEDASTEVEWNTPEAKRIVGQQIQHASHKMAEDIQSLEELMQWTAKILTESLKRDHNPPNLP